MRTRTRVTRLTKVALTMGLALLAGGCGSTVIRTVTAPAPPASSTPTVATTPQPAVASPSQIAPCAQAVTTPQDRKCTLNGTFVWLAHGTGQMLRLKTLDAQLLSIRSASSVSNGPGFTATANGTYLIFTLRITNVMSSPQAFGGIGSTQTVLSLGGSAYSDAFSAENGNDGQSFLTQDTPIQPGESQTGDLIYDVPSAKAQTAISGRSGGLVIANFGGDLSQTIPADSGVITLG